jgi:dinuclear metal center YbgI/SA1388 family protein
MKIKEILSVLEEMAPLAYAEDFDNVGLLVGNQENDVSGILVCHDALESVIDEAIAKKCNLVVCFHPIIFSGLKKITGKNYVERAVLKAIKNDIAIYAVHTALDNHKKGVNKIFSDALGLINTKILVPKQNFIKKLITYTIPENASELRNALFQFQQEKQLPILIETTIEKNKRVYERIGFRVHEERVVSGFKTYCMVKEFIR